ncbi:MAG: hypothetical protein Q7S27_07260 [Nanoarchaeota archaeon]|nr:hypothetical protein [Nanoarchaeota archaeon]
MHAIVRWALKNKIILLLGGILVFAFILRVYQLGDSSMWIDETISSLVAREILDKGVPELDSGKFYGRALFFHYLMAFFIGIFGGDFGARIISVIFGVGSVLLVFFIGREFNSKGGKNNSAGLTAALLSAVLFLEIAYSRQARFYQMFQFLFFLCLFLLYKSKENKKYAWIASFVLIVLVDTHIAGLVVMPLFFYFIIKEQKNWKLLIIPLILCVYYGPGVLGIGTGNSELAGSYIENYSTSLFYHLRAFAIITLIGLPLGFYWNKRLTSILIIPSFVLLFSLVFVKVYALRYAYFIVLLAPIFISVLLYYIYKNNKIFFIVVLLFAVIYPSNLFFESGNLTVLKPENIQLFTVSEPIIAYKTLSSELREEIIKSKSVVLFTPGFSWYYKNPDYFIPFSLNGLPRGYWLYNDVDVYTGAIVFDNQINEFVLLEDAFGYSKLNSVEKEKFEEIKGKCEFVEESRYLKVYRCG